MSDTNTVFIRNVAYEATEEEVWALFAREVGGVQRVHLLADPAGTGNRGIGFVEFVDQNYQRAALHCHYSMFLRGRQIFIQPARPRPENASAPQRSRVQYR